MWFFEFYIFDIQEISRGQGVLFPHSILRRERNPRAKGTPVQWKSCGLLTENRGFPLFLIYLSCAWIQIISFGGFKTFEILRLWRSSQAATLPNHHLSHQSPHHQASRTSSYMAPHLENVFFRHQKNFFLLWHTSTACGQALQALKLLIEKSLTHRRKLPKAPLDV